MEKYTKKDFIKKYVIKQGINSVTIEDVNNAIIDMYKEYNGDMNVLCLKIHNRYGIEVDSDLQTHIEEILIKNYGFDKNEILSIHKIDSKTIGVGLHLYNI